MHPKGTVLCLGPSGELAIVQAVQALGAGCPVVIVAPDVKMLAEPLLAAGLPMAVFEGIINADTLLKLERIAAVAAAGSADWTKALRQALAMRDGPIVPLETQAIAPSRYIIERHLCIDTTAAGGNASLLASTE